MTAQAVASLVEQLHAHRLLKPSHLEEVAGKLQALFPHPKALAKELIQRGWLTIYQANKLLAGQGKELAWGPYVLLDRIGEGGMGQVFKARHRKLNRVLALKVIHKDRLANDAAVRRFHREVRAAAQLSHPNIVHAYDADEAGGVHLLSMEYVDGTDLAKLLKEHGPLPVRETCDYIRQAALGLQHAFEKGLVHRDIKPANLLIAPVAPGSAGGLARGLGVGRSPPAEPGAAGIIKILDMGLARLETDDDGSSSTTLTKEGAVMGTLDYIAPEQAMNPHGVDIRADLYSLGCTFYHLLTGRVPFAGGNAMEKLIKHRLDPPPAIDEQRPDVPPVVSDIVYKLMAKQPEARYQTPAELAMELDALLRDWDQRTVVTAGPASAQPAPQPAAEAQTSTEDALARWAAIVNEPAAPPAPRPAPPPVPPVVKRSWPLRTGAAVLLLGLVALGVFLLIQVLGGKNNAPQPDQTADSQPDQPAPKPPELPKELTNSIGMKLVLIPRGEFLMGSPDSDKDAQAHEKPQHLVRITKPFYLGAYEVKQEQYAALMGAKVTDPNHPAAGVTWEEAVEFCKRLAERPEETGTGRRYRLPTEAEWEYACRAGNATRFHFGESLSPDQAALDRRTPVGSYPPNAFGLYDMHGNVWEWCLDRYDEGYYAQSPADDPQGPAAGTDRVLRGGGAADLGVATCRSTYRLSRRPKYRFASIGFRVVMEQYPPPVTNSIGMKLVPIPAGEFLMGSPDSDKQAAANEKPQHSVRITKPFHMGIYEVTQAEYEKVMGRKATSPDHPVVDVSWEDAVKFCTQLSESPEEKQAGRRYRLPTEAEWEYACRAGTTTPFAFGETLTTEQANMGKSTVRVGSYAPNAWGLYDLYANVWEWCSDWYDANYYKNSPVDDPRGPETGTSHVIRGGLNAFSAANCRSAHRNMHNAAYSRGGFRVVMVPQAP